MTKTKTVQKAIRLNEPILERMSVVLAAMKKSPDYNWTRVTEVSLMRLAIGHGLNHLEEKLNLEQTRATCPQCVEAKRNGP